MRIEVIIEESRTRVVEVEADSPHEAIEMVREEYEKGAHDLSLSEHIEWTTVKELEQK